MGEYDLLRHIPVGTMIRVGKKTRQALERLTPIGIDTVEIHFWDVIPDFADISWFESIAEYCGNQSCTISSLGLYSNPLRDAESKEKGRRDWTRLLELADSFSIPIVSGFTGRIPGQPVEASYEGIKNFYSPVAESCRKLDKKLVFENCPMEGDPLTGDWNTAFLPEIWDILFNEILPDKTVGLEFDPAHLIPLGLPVMDLLKQWMPRIYHIHGKDALPEAPHEFCFPGEGSLDWTEIYTLLQDYKYEGCIDMEGYHGPFVSHEKEVTKQRKCLDYLRQCADKSSSRKKIQSLKASS